MGFASKGSTTSKLSGLGIGWGGFGFSESGSYWKSRIPFKWSSSLSWITTFLSSVLKYSKNSEF